MMQKPDALKDMLSNPELLQQGLKQAQAMFGGAGGANLADLMQGGGLEGLMGGAGDDSDLKQRVRAQMAGVLARAQGVLQRKLVDTQNETRQELLRQHKGLAGLFDGDSDEGDGDDGAPDVGVHDDDDDVRFHDEAGAGADPADDDAIEESPLSYG